MRGKTIQSYFCSLSMIGLLSFSHATPTGPGAGTGEAERQKIAAPHSGDGSAEEAAVRTKNADAANLADRLAFQIMCPEPAQLKSKTSQLWYLKRVFDQWKISYFKKASTSGNKIPDDISGAEFEQMLKTSIEKFGGDTKTITDFTMGSRDAFFFLQGQARKMTSNPPPAPFDSPKVDLKGESTSGVGPSRISELKSTGNAWWKLWGSEDNNTGGSAPYDKLYSAMKYSPSYTRPAACSKDIDGKNPGETLGYKKGLLTETVDSSGKVTKRTYNSDVVTPPASATVSPEPPKTEMKKPEPHAFFDKSAADFKAMGFSDWEQQIAAVKSPDDLPRLRKLGEDIMSKPSDYLQNPDDKDGIIQRIEDKKDRLQAELTAREKKKVVITPPVSPPPADPEDPLAVVRADAPPAPKKDVPRPQVTGGDPLEMALVPKDESPTPIPSVRPGATPKPGPTTTINPEDALDITRN